MAMVESATSRVVIDYGRVHQSLTLLKQNARIRVLLDGTRFVTRLYGAPVGGAIAEVGAATAFTIERAGNENHLTIIDASAISAAGKTLFKITKVLGLDVVRGGGEKSTRVYMETIKASKGEAFLAKVESTRGKLFPQLDYDFFYLGACQLSLILGFEQARKGNKLKEKYQQVVSKIY